LRNLAAGFSRFFKKQNKHPKFKSKGNPVQSYTTRLINNNIKIKDNYLKLPKLGLVKFAKSRETKGKILSATVRKSSSGKYFVAIISDGTKFNNNKFTYKMEKKLKREQRKLSRKTLIAKKRKINLFEASNYQKQKVKVARLHERVTNQRNDFLNKLSTEIVKNHDIICIEDLNIKGMLRNHKLAKSISDVSWSGFINRLKYKADWYDRKLINIDRWFKSSQICSNCKHEDGKKPLKVRYWNCPVCNSTHDRDINASKNILREGLRINALV